MKRGDARARTVVQLGDEVVSPRLIATRTLTERIDLATRAAHSKRPAAFCAFGLFAGVTALAIYLLARSLATGAFAAAATPLYLLGLFAPGLLMFGCIVFRKTPGYLLWGSLFFGGSCIALGPVLVLLAGGWDAEMYVPGRWGGGATGQLRVLAPMLWALAAIMIVPGLAGSVKGALRTRERRCQ